MRRSVFASEWEKMADFVCEQCARGVALLRAASGKQLCLECIEASPDLAGIDHDSVQMMKVVSALSSAPPPPKSDPHS